MRHSNALALGVIASSKAEKRLSYFNMHGVSGIEYAPPLNTLSIYRYKGSPRDLWHTTTTDQIQTDSKQTFFVNMRFSTFVLFAAQLANAMTDEELMRMFSRYSRSVSLKICFWEKLWDNILVSSSVSPTRQANVRPVLRRLWILLNNC